MTTPAKYSRFAVRCLEEARNTTDASLRAFLIEMAQAWQMLANHNTGDICGDCLKDTLHIGRRVRFRIKRLELAGAATHEQQNARHAAFAQLLRVQRHGVAPTEHTERGRSGCRAARMVCGSSNPMPALAGGPYNGVMTDYSLTEGAPA